MIAQSKYINLFLKQIKNIKFINIEECKVIQFHTLKLTQFAFVSIITSINKNKEINTEIYFYLEAMVSLKLHGKANQMKILAIIAIIIM